jgi:SAM-dependent methyltransferase
MRTASEFDAFYSRGEDPWQVSVLGLRDRRFERLLSRHVNDRTVLELGCGEGHHTATLFRDARQVVGVDISAVAIARADKRGLANAKFVASDFMSVSFENYDIVTAIECLYYLGPEEQEQFYRKIVREHSGKTFILSAPIIGSNEHNSYFSHPELLRTFRRHGFVMESYANIDIRSEIKIFLVTRMKWAWRLLNTRFGERLLDFLPEKYIYQRCYVLKPPQLPHCEAGGPVCH